MTFVVRHAPLSFEEVQERWAMLTGGRISSNATTSSFENFGFATEWAREGLRVCHGERPQAVEWILDNESQLQQSYQTSQAKKRQASMLLDLTSLGFPESACENALRADQVRFFFRIMSRW